MYNVEVSWLEGNLATIATKTLLHDIVEMHNANLSLLYVGFICVFFILILILLIDIGGACMTHWLRNWIIAPRFSPSIGNSITNEKFCASSLSLPYLTARRPRAGFIAAIFLGWHHAISRRVPLVDVGEEIESRSEENHDYV